ncbi:MAG: CHRD domain-containing protein [Mycobacteriales bacterium]
MNGGPVAARVLLDVGAQGTDSTTGGTTMSRISRGVVALGAAAAVLAVAGTALADPGHDTHTTMPGMTPASAPGGEPAVFLSAVLEGRNEVPTPGGPAVGDPHGKAVEVLRIQGDKVSYAIRWQNLGTPTAGHVHQGVTGKNGPVVIPFFAPLPATARAVTGTVTVADANLLTALRTNPGGFYANLHTAAFPGGAVRGQLHASRPVDLNGVLRAGSLAALMDGGQEVPVAGKPPVGDPAGHATAFLRADRNRVDYAFSWSGIGAPTEGHVHQGAVGTNGPVVVALFDAPGGLPASVTGLAGVAGPVKGNLVSQIAHHPGGFYANLHTAAFPGGAVRGQLFSTTGRH